MPSEPHGTDEQHGSMPAGGEPPVPLPALLAPARQNVPAVPLQPAEPVHGRLHPLTLVFTSLAAVRRFLIPAIALLLFGNEQVAGALLLVALVFTLSIALARYFTFSYRIQGSELVTRQGILERTERHIPLERVQDIRIEQGIVHRLLAMADVHVETAGGSGPEASFSVLSRAEAERLRQAVFEQAKQRAPQATGLAAAAATATGQHVVQKLSVGELALAGLTSNRMASVFVLLAAAWALADDLLPDDVYERIAQRAIATGQLVFEQGAQTAVAVVVLGAAGIVCAGMLLSVIGSVLLFYDFTLLRAGEDLQRSYGLFTRRSSSLPRRRIQLLVIEEGLLRRMFQLATLRADTAGGQPEGERASSGGRDVLMPIVRTQALEHLLPVFLPDLDDAPAEWQRVSPRAIARGTRKGAFACLVLAGLAIWFHGGWLGVWPLALVPLVYAVNVFEYKNLGYARGERYFRTRRGWLSRATHVVPIRNTQTIVIRQTPFDRRLGLATLIVDTAGQAYTGGGPRISNLPHAEAYALARSLAHQAVQLRYRW